MPKFSEYQSSGAVANTAGPDDLLLITNNPETAPETNVITVSDFAASLPFDGATPANSTITVTKGKLWIDSSYLYVATANNTVKRVALSSF